jgi:hypothetical protein
MERLPCPVLGLVVLLVACLLTAGCFTPNVTGNNPNTTTICPAKNTTSYIILNPVNTTHYVGEVFEINGTTNFDIDKKIKLTFDEPRFGGPFPGIIHYNFTDSEGYVKIYRGDCGVNYWSYTVNLSGFHTKPYIINIYDEPNFTIKNYSESIDIEPGISNGVNK